MREGYDIVPDDTALKEKGIKYFSPDGFTGTESYHRVTLSLGFVLLATDGAVYVFEELKCLWLADVIGSYLERLERFSKEFEEWFFVVKFHVSENETGIVEIEDGNCNSILKQKIPFTDLTKNLKFYLTNEGDKFICLLPSEY
jgi:hypothetical protein